MRCNVLVLTLAVCTLAGCKTPPPAKPLDQLSVTEMEGHRVFTTQCASCHNDRTADPLHGPGLRGLYRKPYLPSGAPANDDRVTATVLHGRNMMPAQTDMNAQDLDNLLAYLHTL